MNKRILVIEDDRDILQGMMMLLEMEGYSVVAAENGQIALDYLHAAETLPDLILLDLMMPVKDGYEFRREQQLDPALAAIPVIIMSADANAEAKAAGMGSKRFLVKPVDINDILGAAATCC
ncbi:MAG TPA: response regulator [Gammaproteobacteria bacterium]|nr:response regulator [Gammaproteobacteria bacterium]